MLILTESSKSPASIAQSNKQGTCLYQEWYKPLLISCEAAIRLWASSEADCEYPLWHADKHYPASSVRSTKRRVRCFCQWELKAPTDRSRSDCSSWASSEARPRQQSCRDGLRMSALQPSALAEGASKTIEYEKGYVSRETLCKKSYKS